MLVESICKSITYPSPFFSPIQKVIPWRDEHPEVARKVATGVVFAGSALLSLIDTVASLALAILSSPLKLGGIKFTDAFLSRAGFNSILGGVLLTIGQYDNITADKISVIWKSRFAYYNL